MNKSEMPTEQVSYWVTLAQIQTPVAKNHPYSYGQNHTGHIGFLDTRSGLVNPIFLEDRTDTSCFLPIGYQSNTSGYWPNRGLGQFIFDHYGDHLEDLSVYLVGGVEGVAGLSGTFDERQSPIYTAFLKGTALIEGHLDPAIKDTFGLAANTLGIENLKVKGRGNLPYNRIAGKILLELSDWIDFYENPVQVLNLGWHNPIAKFKGKPLAGNHDVPKHFQHMWSRNRTFSYNYGGQKTVHDPRNGLNYPWVPGYYGRVSTVMLPSGYQPKESHALLGASFMNASGPGGVRILEELLGIPEAHARKGLLPLQRGGLEEFLVTCGVTTTGALSSEVLKIVIKRHPVALALTAGLALDTMFNNGELSKFILEGLERGWDRVYDNLGSLNNVVTELLRKGLGSQQELKKLENILTNVAPGDPNEFEPDSDDEEDEKKVENLEKKIKEFLGDDCRIFTVKGNKTFVSKDGLKKVRIDIKHPHPHRNPHSHIEIYKNGKWHKSGQIYMKDVGKF